MKANLGWTQAVAWLWMLCAAATQAQSLTRDEAVRRALSGNAGLRAEAAAVLAAENQAEVQALRPALTLGAELENFSGNGAVSGIGSAETTLRLGRVFELGGKAEARQALGASEVARHRNRVMQRRLDVAAEARRRHVDVVARQARLALADRTLELVQGNRDAVRQRVDRGRSSMADLHLAELAVARAELDREDAGHELASARVALAVLWGETTPDFDTAEGALTPLPAADSIEQLAERLARSPDQLALQLESDQIAARRRLAETARRPDLTTSLGVRRFEAFDDQALVLSFSLPLGTHARAQPAIAQHAADQERIEEQSREQALDAYQRLFAQYQELQHARHQVETLQQDMIPRGEQALAATLQGFEEARFSFLQVAEARRVLLELQGDAIDAAARYHRLLADIERATAVSGDQP